jgi:hypothetical protein
MAREADLRLHVPKLVQNRVQFNAQDAKYLILKENAWR